MTDLRHFRWQFRRPPPCEAKADCALTAISGTLVPNATAVSPITIGGTPKSTDSLEVL